MAVPQATQRRVRPRPSTWIGAGAVTAVIALVVTLAAIWPGFDAQQTPLDDASVWALQTGEGEAGYARVNLELRELDTVKRVQNGSSLAQSTNRLFVYSDGDSQYADVSMATPQDLSADTPDAFVPTPAGTVDVVSAGDFLLYRTESGNVYGATLSGGGDAVAIDPYADVVVEEGQERPRFVATAAALSPDGTALVYSAAEARIVRAVAATGRILDEADVPDAPDEAQITAVGDRWALFDPASGELRLEDRSDPVDTGLGADALLQRAAARGDAVHLADSAGVLRVSLDGAEVERLADDAQGTPVAPAVMGSVVYAAWLTDGDGGGSLWSSASGDLTDLPYAGADIGDSLDAVFVSNGARMALNERNSGWVWSVPDGEIIPSSQQWDIEDPSEVEQNNELEAERVVDPKPPVAVDDAFGVRAGSATVLNVVLNDHDPNEDVLSVDPASIEGLDPGFGTVAVAGAEQQLVVRVADDATGSATFRYRVTDGTSSTGLLSEPATVTLRVAAPDENNAPVWCGVDGCLATWPSPDVAPGGTVSTDVLNGWVDPEGDPIYLVRAANDTAVGTVTTAPEGTVTYQHPDPNQSEGVTVSLTVTVSDSRGATADRAMTVSVTPTPELAARSFAVVGVVGEAVTIDVEDYVTGRTGAVALSNAVTLDEARSSVTANPAALSMVFSATEPGSYVVQYTVRDDRSEVTATARVTMRDPAQVAISTPPITAFVRPSEDATIDVFPAVSNPAGLVLLLSDIRPESDSLASLSVDLVGQSMLRVSGTTDTGQPGRLGVVRYTVSDGSGNPAATAQGELTVILLPVPEADPPIAVDDAVTVRAGAQVDIPVLANDSAPAGALIAVDPSTVINESGAGLAFATSRLVRYLAPTQPGTYAIGYTIFRLGFPEVTDTARVTITVVGPETNQAPVPRTLEGRVLSGESVRIPFDTFAVDPDGDAVTLDRIVAQPEQGSAAISAEGDAIIYTSPDAFSGQVRFEYQVRDAEGALGTAQVRVGVLDGQSDPSPVTYSDYIQIQVGETSEAVVRPADNDIDPAGGDLTLTTVAPNAQAGTDEFESLQSRIGAIDDGQVTLRAGSELGTFAYTYGVENETGDTAIGLIIIKVVRDPVPDFPIVQDTTLTIETREQFPRGVDVLTGKVSWNTGDVFGLSLKLWRSVPGIEVDGWRISGEIPEETLLIPFEVSGVAFDGAEVTSYGFLRVPGTRDIRLSLRAGMTSLDVLEKSAVDLDIADAVAIPAGQTLQIAAGEVRAGGARAEASCTVVSGTTIRYAAGAGAPWTDTCVIPAKLATQEDYTYLTVRIDVEAESPQPLLRPASTTVSPGATATFDLDNMLGWAGKEDPAGVQYAIAYSGDQFTVALDGASVTVTAKDAARPGREEPVAVSLSSHPDTPPATLNLTVGPSPSTLPKGGSTVGRCAQSGGATSCTIPVIGVGGEVNPLPGTPLRLVSATGAANCAGVSFAVASESAVRASWAADAAGAADCTGSFVVEDAQGRQSSADRNGQVILDLQGLPANPARVDWTGFGATSVSLRVVSDASSYPAVEGYRITTGGRVVATCTASGECPPIDAPVGEKIGYEARAFNSVGESRGSVSVTAWAYRAPAAPASGAFAPTVTRDGSGGIATITVSGIDPTTGSIQLTGGAGAVTLPAGGVTTLEFRDYPVGSNSPTTLTATPLTRYELPPIAGGSQAGGALTFPAHGIGAPGLQLQVTASTSGDPGTVTATASVTPNGVGERILVGFTRGPLCIPRTAVSAGGGTVTETFPGLDLWENVQVQACAVTEWEGSRFGQSTQSGQAVPTDNIRQPTGDATYSIDADWSRNGSQYTWNRLRGPDLDAQRRFEVRFRAGGAQTTDFAALFPLGGDPGSITAHSCNDLWGCSEPGLPVTTSGPRYTAQATFPTACQSGEAAPAPEVIANPADYAWTAAATTDADGVVTYAYSLRWQNALQGLANVADDAAYTLRCSPPPPVEQEPEEPAPQPPGEPPAPPATNP